MRTPNVCVLLLAFAMAFGGIIRPVQAQDELPYTDTFSLEDCRLEPWGVNNYFIPLKPGSYLLLEGEEDGKTETLLVTVLSRTKMVAGVRCAVVREKHWTDGEIVEVSWNYFAICQKCNDVFYFGEDVDIYEGGKVVSHDGAWLAGKKGAKPGLIMPGRPLIGSRYFQEIAAGVALDRAEHIDDKVTVDTPAGTFDNCLFVSETSPLEPGAVSLKHYARGVGLVQDGALQLVEYGGKRRGGDFEPTDDDED